MFNFLRDLDHTRSDWKVHVRVTRMWTTKGTTNNPFSKNLILLDREDCHVKAFVVPEAWDVLQDMMFEGKIYDIYSFVCCDCSGKLGHVSSNISIVLTSQTVVLPAPNEVSTIPRHKFEITKLSQLYSLTRSYPLDVIPSHAIGSTCIYVNPDYEEMRRVRLREDLNIRLHKFEIVPIDNLAGLIDSEDLYYKPLYATDVVGVLDSLQPIQNTICHGANKQVVRFSITDGRILHLVRFFGPMNQNTAALYDNAHETEVIVILACVRISKRMGKVWITSLPGTKVYINLAYPDVFELRQRLLEDENHLP
ncbi:hypothetical protein DCAR_0623516 [Daucus carota subsp. sativus]|uniref:Replication protein A 70 kDa DNA-binding subunit B/D first OB fold domain-containing protein n=1 Tax=Daucus carota subsp. sativus TaxID=79200 RepID=A0A161YBP1_DAUCS|nr:hypothetical protein DCAR_0623516 [Daucus carota subsp. sativus]